MRLEDLGLIPPLLRAVKDAGYEQPTPIQQQAIPPAIKGRDVIGCAQTGTGKTAAFSLPLLQHLDAHAGDDPKLRALVLTPTRELAAQIGESLTTYGKHLDLWHTVIFGGVSQKKQVDEIKRGVDALVATPGRLLDLMSQGIVSLDHIDFFVLDEADRMLDMGFVHDVKRVTAKLPKKRQTLFFSATMPESIRQLAESLVVDPVSVAVTPVSSTAEKVEQTLYFVDKAKKRDLLLDVLKKDEHDRSLVFSRTKHGANRIVEFLTKRGIEAAAIHGNKSQGNRVRTMEAFRSGALRVLVATDLAARGIDVDGVSHVINFDLPNVPETYVHRIGRTGRAGAEGIALSFCEDEERPYLVDIERLIKQHIERVDDHPFPPFNPPPPMTDLEGRGHGGGGRAGGGRPGGGRSSGGRGGAGGQGGHRGGRRGGRRGPPRHKAQA